MGGAPSRVLDDVWLGGSDAIKNADFFTKNNVGFVLSVCETRPKDFLVEQCDLKVLHINVQDVEETGLLEYFPLINAFLHTSRSCNWSREKREHEEPLRPVAIAGEIVVDATDDRGSCPVAVGGGLATTSSSSSNCPPEQEISTLSRKFFSHLGDEAASVFSTTTAPQLVISRKNKRHEDQDSSRQDEDKDNAKSRRSRGRGRAVYIHCQAGISRSTTSFVCYLLPWLRISLSDALGHAHRCRDAICPNPGFMSQLAKWEHALRKARKGRTMNPARPLSSAPVGEKSPSTAAASSPPGDNSSSLGTATFFCRRSNMEEPGRNSTSSSTRELIVLRTGIDHRPFTLQDVLDTLDQVGTTTVDTTNAELKQRDFAFLAKTLEDHEGEGLMYKRAKYLYCFGGEPVEKEFEKLVQEFEDKDMAQYGYEPEKYLAFVEPKTKKKHRVVRKDNPHEDPYFGLQNPSMRRMAGVPITFEASTGGTTTTTSSGGSGGGEEEEESEKAVDVLSEDTYGTAFGTKDFDAQRKRLRECVMSSYEGKVPEGVGLQWLMKEED
ncbi:unnamed protein product [Amoebophrya sp. A120]|nr:unnamed protein product [Amoebophrya sp. A120]|eukprot:GSA120T00008988001.1